jgi:hypothetical protein
MRQYAIVRAAVCGSAHRSVPALHAAVCGGGIVLRLVLYGQCARQCAAVQQCDSVRQCARLCAAVRVVVCGSVWQCVAVSKVACAQCAQCAWQYAAVRLVV